MTLIARLTVDGLKSDLQKNRPTLYDYPQLLWGLNVGWTLVHQVK
ncbi:hypothetical protein [Colwellia sp. MB02u-1]|nr:hypothetical protein [Colwellia sp. MB02u-1]